LQVWTVQLALQVDLVCGGTDVHAPASPPLLPLLDPLPLLLPLELPLLLPEPPLHLPLTHV
jgi:hypothetical protein